MKRMIFASALVLAGATGATAATVEATEQNLVAIQQFVPDATMADLQAMSDSEILVILNAINAGETGSDRANTVRGLFMDASDADTSGVTTSTYANEANLVKIQQFVPEATMADLAAMDNDRIAVIINEINSGETGSDRAATIRAMFEGDDSTVMNANATSDFVNETNLVKIQSFAPSATLSDLARLGDEDVAQILSIITGGETDGEKRERIQAYFE